MLGYTHSNEVRWAPKMPDLPGLPAVQPDNLGKLPRDARAALLSAMRRAEAGGDEVGEAYRAALLGRSAVVRAALVGRLAS